MAYNLRYYNEFTSRHYHRLVRVEILERDYAGAAEFLDGEFGASLHLSDSGDGREQPIKKLTASLRLNSSSNMKFEHLFTADDRKYQVKIIRNSKILFSGFLESDSYSEPYYSYKDYTVNLTARDNLGRLEDIPYLDGSGDRIEGLELAEDIVERVLAKTGLNLNLDSGGLRILSSDMIPAPSTLQQTYINNDAFWDFEENEPLSCLDVLTNILTGFGAQIRQLDFGWFIFDQAKFYNLFTVQGNSASFPGYLEGIINFTPVVKDFRWINRDAEMTILPAWKEFAIEQDYGVTPNVFKDFPKSLDDFTDYTGAPSVRGAVTLNGWNMQDVPYVRSALGGSAFTLPSSYVSGGSPLGSLITPYIIVKTTTNELILTLNVGIIGNAAASKDLKIDLIIGDTASPSSGSILTDNGWITYNGTQSKQLSFDNLKTTPDSQDLTVRADGIPQDGFLIIRIWPDLITTNFAGFRFYDINIELSDSVDGVAELRDITGVIDENNNLTPSDFETNIGQTPTNDNAKLIYLGGLFDSTGETQEDWKRSGDTTAKDLLEQVAIGYDLQNKQPARQVNGTVIWDHDIWTNIDDQNKRLMINSIDEWNLHTDAMTAEFVEVFEYVNTLGAYDLGFDDNYDNNISADYNTNTIFEIVEKFE